MKKILLSLSCHVWPLIGMLATAGAEQKPVDAVTAEVWNFDIPAGVSAKSVFEQWRAQVPPEDSIMLPIDGLSIPAREGSTMVRVTGEMTAPLSGLYAFTVHAPDMQRNHRPDETELWIHDEATGEWKLAQCTGNPVKTGGRTRFEAGVPKRFELWTMGREKTVVQWHVTELGKIDPATGRSREVVPRQTVPGSALSMRKPTVEPEGEAIMNNDGMGPDGPWGDPDGDGLPNWRERSAGTDPQVADVEEREGLIRWETWRDIPGRYVFDLRRAVHFPNGPREVRFLDRLEIPAGTGERCGSRLRGWLVAPADGEYRIGISSEDQAELWLGENESWQSKRLVAKADQFVSGRLRWYQRDEKGANVPLDSEQNARVRLKAGVRYYLEILHKQDTGPDHCFVAWIKPGAEKAEIIGKEHLVSWKPCPTDTDDDGLPDEWQRSAKLVDDTVEPAMRQAEADPDRDGATNRDEWLAGTDPLSKADSPPGGHLLTSETWTGIAGRSVSSLTGDGRYPARPDFATRIDNLDFANEGENYGVRLRGFLTAPKDGDYQFTISGNNACTLYLAASEDKFTKRVVSRVEVGTRWRAFNLPGHAPSAPIPLESGKSYYIEVIYKRGVVEENKNSRPDPGDHSSVAWKRPGERSFSVIPPGVFTAYRADPRDLDDDDLPDDWETRHRLDPATTGGEHGAWGDPDGDGLENFREYQLGLDPNATDVHGTPSLALYEAWDNIPGLIAAHREQSGLFPALCQDPRFPLEPSRRDWRDTLETPRRQGNDYGGRLRARIIPPVTGEYLFSIAGRDVGVLFFSADGSKFNRKRIASIDHGTALHSWDKRPGQVSAPVKLEAGKACYIEALVGRGAFPYDDDFFSIAWKPPGSETFQVIGAEHLVAFFRDPNDQDDDDLPDDWEKRFGLDVTDPHGEHGPHGDPDRDSLTNMEEYQLGSDPRNGDTDGDGVTDHDEIHVYGSDPLVKDVIAPVKDRDMPLDGLGGGAGDWINTPDGGIRSLGRQATLHFNFHVDKPGIHLLEMVAQAVTANQYAPGIPVVASLNGRELGRSHVSTAGNACRWLTPWLGVGSHTVTFNTLNFRLGQRLEVRSVSLFRHDGPDNNDNGIPDWLEGLLQRFSAVDSPTISFVSPLCLEGRVREGDSVRIALRDAEIPVLPSVSGRWFANVPLIPTAPTTVAVQHEGGALTSEYQLEWQALDLFACPPRITLRQGDSLKVSTLSTGGTSGQPERIRVLLDGTAVASDEALNFHILRFANPGRYSLDATAQGGSSTGSTKVVVDVLAADFGKTFNVASGFARVWTLNGIPGEMVIESDTELYLRDLNTPSAPSKRQAAFFDGEQSGEASVIARLPGGGPIAASTRVNLFRVVNASENRDARVVDELPDGTRMVEFSLMIDGIIPEDLSILVEMAVTDAVFPNGKTSIRLSASDFDQDQCARLMVYKAPSVGIARICHRIFVYPDDQPAANGSN